MNTQTKWLVGIVVVLVLLNIGLVAMMWLKKDDVEQPGPKGDARDYLVKELALNQQQITEFDEMREGHFEKMRGYKEQMRRLKDDFFDQLKYPINLDSLDGIIDFKPMRNGRADTLAKEIGDLQTKIDLETFEHFFLLRSILNDEQKVKFDNTIQEVLRTMGPRRGPPPGRRPGEGPPL